MIALDGFQVKGIPSSIPVPVCVVVHNMHNMHRGIQGLIRWLFAWLSQLNLPKRDRRKWTTVRQMLSTSYFWAGRNSYARLGVFHTIFSTKRSLACFFPQTLRLKFLIIIRFFSSVAYCTRKSTKASICIPGSYVLVSVSEYRRTAASVP